MVAPSLPIKKGCASLIKFGGDATRQNRLGQSDARTTVGYTHAISEDGRRFAARLGELLTAGNAGLFGPNWTLIAFGWEAK